MAVNELLTDSCQTRREKGYKINMLWHATQKRGIEPSPSPRNQSRLHAPPPAKIRRKIALTAGFTLIEMSIVLVIIGLIVGGVLVGQSLINAAAVRAQISQIEKYNTAVNTFRGKYNALPGDMNAATASQFGFVARTGTEGRGDGNGIIEGFNAFTLTAYGWNADGEPLLFWEDLSSNQFIDGTFNTATDIPPVGNILAAQVPFFLPAAKINSGAYVYVFSVCHLSACSIGNPGVNYFGLTAVGGLNSAYLSTGPVLSVAQAYKIDTKVDDGMPEAGNVQAFYPGGNDTTGNGGSGWAPSAASASGSTCFDTTSNQYSMTQNGGAGVNCNLSFRFQ